MTIRRGDFHYLKDRSSLVLSLQAGWITAFMSLLDRAYPGNDNVLINAGKGALPLWGYVEVCTTKGGNAIWACVQCSCLQVVCRP